LNLTLRYGEIIVNSGRDFYSCFDACHKTSLSTMAYRELSKKQHTQEKQTGLRTQNAETRSRFGAGRYTRYMKCSGLNTIAMCSTKLPMK